MTGKFVAYYRVSTTKQGINGLGMDAQRNAVMNYLNGGDWNHGRDTWRSGFIGCRSMRSAGLPAFALLPPGSVLPELLEPLR
jgi:DNA invertase Pin-like site-specific DNA recombinase